MLFKASITKETLKSQDLLVEQLYIFLDEYVRVRLRYESDFERDDCKQDTIMYLLKRYDALDKFTLQQINIEKFFYNRAHSFISLYLSKLKKERDNKKKYIETVIYNDSLLQEDILEYIDYDILNNILSSFNLDKEKTDILRNIVEHRFSYLGYEIDLPADNKNKALEHVVDLLDALSYAVIDEYMEKSVQEELV